MAGVGTDGSQASWCNKELRDLGRQRLPELRKPPVSCRPVHGRSAGLSKLRPCSRKSSGAVHTAQQPAQQWEALAGDPADRGHRAGGGHVVSNCTTSAVLAERGCDAS